MKCPHCFKSGFRQLVYVAVDCDAENGNLTKAGIRKKDVKIEAVNWSAAIFRCFKCGYRFDPKKD